MRSALLVMFLVIFSGIYSQSSDTITILSYNLLNFPDGRNDCSNNTVVPDRYDTLLKIIEYTQPDIFVACEVQVKRGADSVLTRSLNVNGITKYAMANWVTNTSGFGGLNNILFYNTDKLVLHSQFEIENSTRDINHYILYARDPNLANHFDTTFYEVFMCHLKAGSGSAEQAVRNEQVQIFRDYMDARPLNRHYFFCGDLNVYTSNEAAYQTLISGGINPLVDPINRLGNWNNNGAFDDVHTQSTRSSGNFDCGSTGGLDDRFDQILVSSNVLSGEDSVRYIANSYKAIGNDGNHFNSSITTGSNSQYPADLVRALFYMSDHLPVLLKTKVTYPTSNGLALFPTVVSPSCFGIADGSATITPNAGQAPYTYLWDAAAGNQETATATNLSGGSYCVQVTDDLGEVDEFCVFVNQPALLQVSSFVSPSYENCNGSAAVLVSGGEEPYTYVWSDGSIGNVNLVENLCPGNYSCEITDNNGCSVITELEIFDQTVFLAELALENLVNVFPNPTHGALTIQNKTTLNWDDFNISIFSTEGKLIYNQQLQSLEGNEQFSIDLSFIHPGLYFLELDGITEKRLKIQVN